MGAVLNLAPVTEPHSDADVRTPTDCAALTEHGSLAQLSQVPHCGSVTKYDVIGDVG
jgi:hypothetical protein